MEKGRIVEDDMPELLSEKHSSIFENLNLQNKKSREQEEQQEAERKKSEEIKH